MIKTKKTGLGFNKRAKDQFDKSSSRAVEELGELSSVEETIEFIKEYAKSRGLNDIYDGLKFSSVNEDQAGKVYIVREIERPSATLHIKTLSGPLISTKYQYPTYVEISFGHLSRFSMPAPDTGYINYWNKTWDSSIHEHLKASVIVELFDEALKIMKHYEVNETRTSLGLNKRAKEIHQGKTAEDTAEEIGIVLESVEDSLREFTYRFVSRGYYVTFNSILGSNIDPPFEFIQKTQKPSPRDLSKRTVDIRINYVDNPKTKSPTEELKIKNFICHVHPHASGKSITVCGGFSANMHYDAGPGKVWVHDQDSEKFLEAHGVVFNSPGGASLTNISASVLTAIFEYIDIIGVSPVNESNTSLGLNKRAKRTFDFDSTVDSLALSLSELCSIEEAKEFIRAYAKARGFNDIHEGFKEVDDDCNDDPAGTVYLEKERGVQSVVFSIKTSSERSVSNSYDYPTYVGLQFGYIFRADGVPNKEDYIYYWNKTWDYKLKAHLPVSVIVELFDSAIKIIEHRESELKENRVALGLNKRAKDKYKAEDAVDEMSKDFIKSYLFDNIRFIIGGDNEKPLDDNLFGIICDMSPGIEVDDKTYPSCMLWTISYNDIIWISSYIVADTSIEGFWYMLVHISDVSCNRENEMKIYPDEFPDEVRAWLDDNVMIE